MKLKVPGQQNLPGSERPSLLQLPGDLPHRTLADISVFTARADTPAVELEVDPDALVEVELDNGVRLWTSLRLLREDEARRNDRSAAADDELLLSNLLQVNQRSRGFGAWAIKGLRIVGIDLEGEIAEFVGRKVEGRLEPGPGFYRCTLEAAQPLAPFRESDIRGDAPMLVFLHGTASSTDGSFGALWEGAACSRMARLLEHYRGNVFALQHQTLTLSPIQNALDLVAQLPKGARLHLVSHSRGGLIGELLCRTTRDSGRPFDETDLDTFASLERAADVKALSRLGDLMQQKKFSIERFVRVACPARGTTLADRRLDRYLSVMLNLLGPVLKKHPVVEGLSALLAGVVKKRTDPRTLPGLEAMMPDSPLITMLNRIDVRAASELHVLGGDLSGDTFFSALKEIVTNLYYREDHDLVVNTPAMFGGAQRLSPIRYWIDEGREVCHFNYFKRDSTAERLMAALINPQQASFHTLEQPGSTVAAGDYQKRAVEARPVVFVLPGIMGTSLKAGEDRVWMNLYRLGTGGMARLKLDSKDVTADQPLDQGYGALMRLLSDTHEVIPFGYDWRQPIQRAADRLTEAISRKLQETASRPQPIRILAHSMGGLVVRAMMADPKGRAVWDAMMARRGSRFIMLGTPNGGSHSIAAMLMGRDPLVSKLALLDVVHRYDKLLAIIAAWPGVMDLLPDTGTLNLFRPDAWERLRKHDVPDAEMESGKRAVSVLTDKSAGVPWSIPDAALLAEAERRRQRLKSVTFNPDQVIYVAGAASATPIDVTINDSAKEGRQVLVHATTHGDGRVPWETGIPAELRHRAYYMDVKHGDMAAHEESFAGILELLTTGTTTKLSTVPPQRRDASSARFILPPEPAAMFPDEEDLVASALGGTRRAKKKVLPKVRVRVEQSNLSYARSPVVVGHYLGDSIVSAERYLDRVLEGRLSERRNLGLYPGALDTAEVFLSVAGGTAAAIAHPGAVVIGLGQVGDLSPRELTKGFARGAILYAADKLEAARANPAVTWDELELSLTTLLIGSGAGGFSVNDSVQAILRGVNEANARLRAGSLADAEAGDSSSAKTDTARRLRPPHRARISELVIIEAYEDRAIQAARALAELSRSEEFRKTCDIQSRVVVGQGCLRRAAYDEDASWWRRVRIEAPPNGLMRFEVISDRARTLTCEHDLNVPAVEALLQDAIQHTANDPELASTLFEMLVPNRIKQLAPDRRHVVLMLDEAAAAYPWELMQNRYDLEARPLAVEAGMVRQLRVQVARERPAAPTGLNALVIGDPENKDPRLPALPGAREEARQVAQQLRAAGYNVSLLVGPDATPRSVLSALHARGYRIIHFAAHGVLDVDEIMRASSGDSAGTPAPLKSKPVAGMALGGGAFLKPGDLEQMRIVPDIVFLNCCHLGQTKTEQPLHRVAANLATQLIRMGVRGVIAAGWAVDDAAGLTFAQVFHREFMNKTPFGEAVRLAREAAFAGHMQANTWGAYQCYGDPDFSLAGMARPRAFVSKAELQAELENIVEQAKFDSRDKLNAQLDAIIKSLPEEWLSSATTRAVLGKVCGALGRTEEAIEHLEASRDLNKASLPVDALEKLANYRARHAEARLSALARTKPDEIAPSVRAAQEADARVDLDRAERELHTLLLVSSTPERFCLLGSLYKRRALVETDAAQAREAVRQMSDYYRQAHELRSDPNSPHHDPNDNYPLINWLIGEAVLRWADPARTAPADALARLRAQTGQRGSDVWGFALAGNERLVTAAFAQAFENVEEVAQFYQMARERAASPAEADSMLNQIEFLDHAAAALSAPAAFRKDIQRLCEMMKKPGH